MSNKQPYLCTALAFLFLLCATAQADSSSEEVRFSHDGITLVGTLTLPASEGPHPAIILISGSGPQDRDGANPALPGYLPFRWLADHLVSRGVAVLRFDERGIGASGGDHSAASSADFAEDNIAALRYLQERDDINPAQIGFLGHSEGAMIAAMVAAQIPELAFLVMMGGAAVPGYDVLTVQLEQIMRASGASEEELDAARLQQQTLLDLTMAQDWEALEPFIYDILLGQLEELPEEQQAEIGDLEAIAQQSATLQLEASKSDWFQLFLSYDPAQDYRQITIPVLLLFGGLDTQVDLAQNRPVFETVLAEAGNEDVTIVVFEEANHLFQKAITGSPDEYLALELSFIEGFLDTISDWLLERLD